MEYFFSHFERLADVIGKSKLIGQQALIIGPEPDEALLLQRLFPGIKQLHLVEWHEPKLDYLEQVLTGWQEKYPQFAKAQLHLADAVNMEGIPTGAVQLVHMHQVVEFIEDQEGLMTPSRVPVKVLDVFREIKRVLAPDGHLFTLESKIDGRLESSLYDMGFERVRGNLLVLQSDIWRKTR